MQKEIFEQPDSIINTMRGRVMFDQYKGISFELTYVCSGKYSSIHPCAIVTVRLLQLIKVTVYSFSYRGCTCYCNNHD